MEQIKNAASFMREFGPGIWMVGGAVRDMVLGIEPKDMDFAVQYHPNLVRQILIHMGILSRNIDMKDSALGIVRVDWRNEEYEIMTLRTETYTPGSRKPIVKFVTILEEDAKRRDFNINSIYWSGGSEGHIDGYYDPYNALETDFEGNITGLTRIITTNKPEAISFSEDPLRVLRYIRFNKMYGEGTYTGIKGYFQNIVALSPQKIRQEMEKGFKVSSMYKAYLDSGILDLIIPFYYHKKVYSHNFPFSGEPVDCWAFLMREHVARPHFSKENNVTLIEKVLRQMEFSKDEIRKIVAATGIENQFLKNDWIQKSPMNRLFPTY